MGNPLFLLVTILQPYALILYLFSPGENLHHLISFPRKTKFIVGGLSLRVAKIKSFFSSTHEHVCVDFSEKKPAESIDGFSSDLINLRK